MYFYPEPKEKKQDLFGFEEEYRSLKTAIEGRDRLIFIKGLRRAGKTSLMKVVYSEYKGPKCFLDGRIIEPKQKNIMTLIASSAVGALTDSYMDIKAREIVQSLRLDVLGVGISLRKGRTMDIFVEMDKILERKKTKLAIFIDEVQKIKTGNIDGIIAYLFEHTKNIKFVFAGSEIGLLDEVMGSDAKSNLYGRPKKVIEISRLSKGQAMAFLKAGFAQAKKKIDNNEIEGVVEKTDGVMGWLTLFGYYSIDEGKDQALKKVVEEGAKITASEIETFLSLRKEAGKNYLSLLEAMATGLRWIEAKRVVEAKSGKTNDKTIAKYLNELEKYSFIIKENNLYVIADPMIKEGVDLIIHSK